MTARQPANRKESSRRDFLAGSFLIAMPNMRDPRFEKSVVLVCAHDKDHAMGVIVNKPLGDVELGELLEQLDIDPREGVGGDSVHFGGPVQTERGLVLHSLDYRLDATLVVCDGIGLTTSREILCDIGGRQRRKKPPKDFLVAIGHAGWGAGQLEAEFTANAWIHCPADAALLFSDNPSTIWTRALQSLGVTGAMFSPEWASTRPDDAPLN